MASYLWVAVLFAFLALVRAQSDSESRPICFETPPSTAQCGCKTIQNKLDQLDQRVSQMFDQQQNKPVSVDSGYTAALDQLEQRLSQKIDQLQDNLNRNLTNLVQNLDQQRVGRAFNGSSAVENNVSVQYVDTQFGSNWIIVLQRTDGSVNFARPWVEYRNGFGTVGQNFWLGLEKMHQLTKGSRHELAIEMTDLSGDQRFVRFDRFEIGSEELKYPLVSLGNFVGSAGDSFTRHLGKSFSTYDNGSDIATSKLYGNGGWWFFGNYNAYLTGQWIDNSWAGIWWGNYKSAGQYARLTYARMIIRAV